MTDTQTLRKFTMVAERIIYDPKRINDFAKMLRTREGALRAVQTVMGAIDQLKPIPPELRPYLAANVYVTMVSLVSEGTGAKPDPNVMKEVIAMLLADAQQSAPAPAPAEEENVMTRMGVPA